MRNKIINGFELKRVYFSNKCICGKKDMSSTQIFYKDEMIYEYLNLHPSGRNWQKKQKEIDRKELEKAKELISNENSSS